MWKRGDIAPPLFHIILQIFLTSGVKLHIHLLNVVAQFIVFLTLSTLICRGTDILKCFSESLGIRDNESQLYFHQILYFNNSSKGEKSGPRVMMVNVLKFHTSNLLTK